MKGKLISWNEVFMCLTGHELNIPAFRSFNIFEEELPCYPHYSNTTKRVAIRVCLN
jgi:hypothetical protein